MLPNIATAIAPADGAGGVHSQRHDDGAAAGRRAPARAPSGSAGSRYPCVCVFVRAGALGSGAGCRVYVCMHVFVCCVLCVVCCVLCDVRVG